MILWTVKLVGMIRRAIAGRKYPYQLAWAVAFGLLLGIVPHGNLLAVGLVIVVLSLRLNHAMAALTAVGASFLATRLDPASHTVGEFLLTQPKFAELAGTAWALPMVPWTDLNNTVVLGSFTIGIVALLPIFMVTYPIFRWLAPVDKQDDELNADEESDSISNDHSSNKVVIIDRGSDRVPAPKRDTNRQPSASQAAAKSEGKTNEPIEFVEVHAPHQQPAENHTAVETRIDVIRIKEQVAELAAASQAAEGSPSASTDNQPMDEALNYLLRQLRDSQQRNAA